MDYQPHITATRNIEDGYMVRALCMVDGYPAEVVIRIEQPNRQRGSEYYIQTFDPIERTWALVYHLELEEVGRLGYDGNDPENLAQLNMIAYSLWNTASMVMRESRERQEELAADTYVRHSLALDDARAARMDTAPEWVGDMRAEAEAAWHAPEVDHGEFVMASHPADDGTLEELYTSETEWDGIKADEDR